MTDAQFVAIRELGLRLVSTLLDGTLVVRERDGTRLLLSVDGDLSPYAEPVPD